MILVTTEGYPSPKHQDVSGTKVTKSCKIL
jgi:hypothetical protein